MEKIRNDQEEAAWTKWQMELAHLSSNSTLIVAQGVGHEIQTDKPEIVVSAIQRMVQQWRGLAR